MSQELSCKHEPKAFRIRYDNGSLQRDEVWNVCKRCADRPEFQRHQLSVEVLEAQNVS